MNVLVWTWRTDLNFSLEVSCPKEVRITDCYSHTWAASLPCWCRLYLSCYYPPKYLLCSVALYLSCYYPLSIFCAWLLPGISQLSLSPTYTLCSVVTQYISAVTILLGISNAVLYPIYPSCFYPLSIFCALLLPCISPLHPPKYITSWCSIHPVYISC
jgi:hypothetical protein